MKSKIWNKKKKNIKDFFLLLLKVFMTQAENTQLSELLDDVNLTFRLWGENYENVQVNNIYQIQLIVKDYDFI